MKTVAIADRYSLKSLECVCVALSKVLAVNERMEETAKNVRLKVEGAQGPSQEIMVKLSISYCSILCRCLVVCLLMAAAPALAQEATSAATGTEDAVAADTSHPLYWAQMREVYTVQKR